MRNDKYSSTGAEQPDGDSGQAVELSGGWVIKTEQQPDKQDIPNTGVNTATNVASNVNVTSNANAVTTEAPETSERTQRSNLMLMILGVMGGVYLLYTLGWAEIAKAYSPLNEAAAQGSGSLGSILQNILFYVAPFAPAAWFFTAVTITQRFKTMQLSLALLAGAVLLFPFPFVFAGGAG